MSDSEYFTSIQCFHCQKSPDALESIYSINLFSSFVCAACFHSTAYSIPLATPMLPLTISTQCDLHQRKLELLCSDCNSLLCIKCIMSHRSHQILDIDLLVDTKPSLLSLFFSKCNSLNSILENLENLQKQFEAKYMGLYDKTNVMDLTVAKEYLKKKIQVYHNKKSEILIEKSEKYSNFRYLVSKYKVEAQGKLELAEVVGEGLVEITKISQGMILGFRNLGVVAKIFFVKKLAEKVKQYETQIEGNGKKFSNENNIKLINDYYLLHNKKAKKGLVLS